MLFLTRWFGVTGSDAERNPDVEQAASRRSSRSLLMQANAAAEQQRPLGRGTHVKGICARAKFEVFDVTCRARRECWRRGSRRGSFRAGRISRDRAVRERGSESTPISSPTFVRCRFRSILSRRQAAPAELTRQDFSLQNATTLPINDAAAFLAMMKVLTARTPPPACGR